VQNCERNEVKIIFACAVCTGKMIFTSCSHNLVRVVEKVSVQSNSNNMPKMKTRKAIAKRVRITKSKKVLKKKAGQDHFNARESGKKMRNKRRLGELSCATTKNVRKTLPYS